jgi:hypothetical protein
MGPICNTETSVSNHLTLHNNCEFTAVRYIELAKCLLLNRFTFLLVIVRCVFLEQHILSGFVAHPNCVVCCWCGQCAGSGECLVSEWREVTLRIAAFVCGGEHFAFSDACTDFGKAPFEYVMSTCIEQLGSHWTEFD